MKTLLNSGDASKIALPVTGVATDRSWMLKDGTAVTIRSAHPRDANRLQGFHQAFAPLLLPAQQDTDTVTLVALRRNRRGDEEIVATAHLHSLTSPEEAVLTLVVAEQCRNRGLGTQLLSILQEHAGALGIETLVCQIPIDSDAMQRVCLKLGFALHHAEEAGIVTAYRKLCPRSSRDVAEMISFLEGEDE
jgi:RimJ/RimL family protein N-acetyltransferase